MVAEPDWKDLAKALAQQFEKEAQPDAEYLHILLQDRPSACIALALEELTPEQVVVVFNALDEQRATEVLAKLDPTLAREVIRKLPPGNLANLVANLPPREAAAVVAEAPQKYVRQYLKDNNADPSAVNDVECRLQYPAGSAGRLMTTQFVLLPTGVSVSAALEVVRKTNPAIDIPDDLYVVADDADNAERLSGNRLVGVVSIRDLLMSQPEQLVDEIMAKDIISVSGMTSDDDAAALVSKYKFMTLPILDKNGYLAGVIPSDDLMQVIVSRTRRLYTQAVGTDAETMEKLTPLKAARLRVPWLMGTMLIELLAGIVISHFDGVLQKVILLASFMPVISAISGNVGLQAAAITVRALDSTQTTRRSVSASLLKEGATSLIMALICGLVLGSIGAVWSKHLPFGIVIGAALTCSMLTAGLMGTIIPVVSKRMGFDPATTAGPFETAFQDVIGFSVFLWLASLLQHWIA